MATSISSATMELDPETAGLIVSDNGNNPRSESGEMEENRDSYDGRSQNEISPSSAEENGSSIADATFNFTNSILGAGAIGLGGAMAVSGGFVSIALIVFFGYLTKRSLDLVIRLSVETEGAHGSYEDLAQVGLGRSGRYVVMICKLAYAFGCLVAYIVVIKDNFAPALRNLIYGQHDYHQSADWFHDLLTDSAWFTWLVSLVCILPLCLLRDMTPLASFSIVSVISMVSIVGIVIYIYFFCPDIGEPGGSFSERWLEVRPGVLESLGTFVFSFVSQHTVHLVFGSLKPSLRTVESWKVVSTLSLLSSTVVSLSVGVFVYMTFGEDTKSDVFQIYPQGWLIDLAKLLLCITMILTFPLPFFTCRELLVVTLVHPFCGIEHGSELEELSSDSENDLQEPLLDIGTDNHQSDRRGLDTSSIVTEISGVLIESVTPKNWLLPDDDRQLQFVGHITLTVKLWIVTTGFAIAAPSLGDVLDLVGCASGTVIAFLLPALLSFRIDGYSHLAMILFTVGSLVGTVGTFFSLKKLFLDLKL